jgi:ankyrin repeat protein
MRLLHVDEAGGNSFSLVERTGVSVPPYAILSHVWGHENDEVTYRDLLRHSYRDKVGYRKLRFCAQQAVRDGLQYFWIDTCCIDKSSSAELAEAIISMFRWYNASSQCYVYLPDVSIADTLEAHMDEKRSDFKSYKYPWEFTFRNSVWFKRGWTLQELLAPRSVKLFSVEGEFLGDRLGLVDQIHLATDIPSPALRGAALSSFPVPERMRWMEKRRTKREEDMSYSLLGIFGAVMPPLYGEGKEAASKRLQKEIGYIQKAKQSPLDEKQKDMLMSSLRFEKLDARHLTIKNAHIETCEWLLKAATYHEWLDRTKIEEHHGFLWIRGKPGTGKSTLMKFALANARRTAGNDAVIAYFFNARGEDLEKSIVGTYRALLLQLLEQLPALQGVFESSALSSQGISANYQWSHEALQTLLEQAIQSLGQSHVVCFIDALDECDEQQIRSMVSFFERVGQLTVSAGIHFQVCLSSRHYPTIRIEKSLSLVLEGQEGHTRDITNFLKSALRIGKSELAEQIRSELQAKASGVFMWVVLVVDILNQEYDRGRMHALRRRLREIPTDLHALFRDILIRDSRNKEELILCIQWVLFARRPLSPAELFHAILSGVEPDAVTAWDCEEVTESVVRRFILDSSKGLTEITKADAPTVQFIHESVRDFLLKENDLGNIWPELRHNFGGQSHERLKKCCLSYIILDIQGLEDIPEIVLASNERARRLRVSVSESFPFMEYAVHHVLYHADAAQESNINQELFILEFPRVRWIRLDNLLEKHQRRWHTHSMSLLYILAEHNMANLITANCSARSCFEVESERYGTPFLAAVASERIEAILAFVNALHTDEHLRAQACDFFQRLHQQGKSLLLEDFEFPMEHDIVSFLLNSNNRTLITLAIVSGQVEFDETHDGWSTPLIWACKKGYVDIVDPLVKVCKVDINARDHEGATPLVRAAASGHLEIVKLLLGTINIQVNVGSNKGLTALMSAAQQGHYSIVKTLLDTDKIDVNAADMVGETALMKAVRHRHEDTAALLLNFERIDINAKDKDKQTALMKAARYRCEDAVKLLLGMRRLDINAKDRDGLTALMHAASCGHRSIVESLRSRLH